MSLQNNAATFVGLITSVQGQNHFTFKQLVPSQIGVPRLVNSAAVVDDNSTWICGVFALAQNENRYGVEIRVGIVVFEFFRTLSFVARKRLCAVVNERQYDAIFPFCKCI